MMTKKNALRLNFYLNSFHGKSNSLKKYSSKLVKASNGCRLSSVIFEHYTLLRYYLEEV